MLQNAQILSDGLMIASDCAANLREIGQLTRKSRADFQKPWNLGAPGDVRDLWDVAFDDGIDVCAVPIMTSSFGTALNGIRVTAGRYKIKQVVAVH